ncbi:MAG: hypothetical protein HY738_22570 [Bacteroidia bacterium]|nr:hypothetical protein [Bacteroidia bacterium]
MKSINSIFANYRAAGFCFNACLCLLFLFFVCIFFICNAGFSQEWAPIKTDESLSYYFLYLSKKDSSIDKLVKKPIIGLGRGFFTFYGDIRDNYSSWAYGRLGTRLNISRYLNSWLKLDFSVIYGRLTGNQRTLDKNFNFQTDVLCGSAGVLYNFEHLLKLLDEKMKVQYINNRVWPYISLGLESFEFNSKGDLRDANNWEYYYWSDGTIRNIPESSENTNQSIILQRDYVYETDLREMNADGIGKYAQIAFAIPFEFGVEMFLTERFSIRTGLSYHFSLNDKVDNITKKGSGIRHGNNRKDGFLFTFVSVHYDLFNKHVRPPWQDTVIQIPDYLFDFQDEDEDGIHDLIDECAFTQKGIKVNVKGCPLDTDKDGIGQFMDEEPETADKAIVNLKGVTMTEDEVGDTLAIMHKDIYKWYPSLQGEILRLTGELVMPDKWKKFDVDNDEYISFDEINKVIDAWFDFKIDLTLDDILELNEFFFSQASIY